MIKVAKPPVINTESSMEIITTITINHYKYRKWYEIKSDLNLIKFDSNFT